MSLSLSEHLRNFFPATAVDQCIFHRNKPEMHPSQKTILVVGTPSGGTSACAAVIEALGIFMGPENKLRAGGTFENEDFMVPDNEVIKSHITEYNTIHDVWGWKNPHGMSVLECAGHVRNPYLIFVIRDPVALCTSRVRNGMEPIEALESSVKSVDDLVSAMKTTPYPSAWVSYERLKSTPEFMIFSIAEFLGITPTPREWVEALGRVSDRGGYINMPREFGPGPGNEPRK